MGGVSGQWDEAGESWADFVRSGKDYYGEELNLPATFRLIGDVKGLRVLDLACGEGRNAQRLAEMDARVVGVDFSKELIALARREEERSGKGVEYQVSDATRLGFDAGSFDLVFCFMGLHDIEDYEKAIAEASRVLKEGGRFVFSIPHPCFESRAINGRVVADWSYAEKTPEGDPLYFAVENYFDASAYTVPWTMERLIKPFRTTSFHRTLTDYFNALAESNLLVHRLVESKPTKKGVEMYPSLRKRMRIPQSIVVEAFKVSRFSGK